MEEALEKWKTIKNNKIKLHFIGALQSKKVATIINKFDVIETLDTESSAKKIASYFEKNTKKKIPNLYVQINLGKEKQKRGVYASEIEMFLDMCLEKYNLKINGAMCIPPVDNNPEKYFKTLKEICVKHKVKEVSMGMSKDYIKAIEFGSTNIRIGTVLFGERKQK